MRKSIDARLQKIERQRRPTPGALPTIIVIPDSEPDRAQALADVARRRARGDSVIAVGEHEDSLAALVEVFAP